MSKSIGVRQAARRAWLPAHTLALLLALALMATTALAEEAQPTEPDIAGPSDAELTSELKPVVLSETREGDVTTLTIEIPVGADTFITSAQPGTNWSTNEFMRLGYNTVSGLGAERVYLFFSVNSIPPNAVIQEARIRAYVTGFSPNGDSPMNVQARYLNSFWDPGTITWNNQPAWGSDFGVGSVPGATGWIEASVPSVIQEWVSGDRPNYGFVLIGDETPQQRDRVFFTINAANDLHPRLIVTYDIDTIAPNATVLGLPQFSPGTFTVQWQGTDSGGSGIDYYDVQVRAGGGSWVNWLNQTTATSGSFGGSNGVLYEFRARAVDNAGNEQAWSTVPQAATTVDTLPPAAAVLGLPQFSPTTFTVQWQGTDNLSGIEYYDVQYRVNQGTWTDWQIITTATSAQFSGGVDGALYEFRARAVDNAGNIQPHSTIAQAATTVSAGVPVARIIPFTTAVVNANSFTVAWEASAATGATIVSYDLQYRHDNGSWILVASGTAATSLLFTAPADGVYEFQVRARDNFGRVSEWSSNPGSTIAVDVGAPPITPRIILPFIVGGSS